MTPHTYMQAMPMSQNDLLLPMLSLRELQLFKASTAAYRTGAVTFFESTKITRAKK